MSATGLEVFDRTLHTTNIWLGEISDRIGPDRQLAWKVLSTVLHKLRERLPVEVAAHLGAQLPLLVRGAFYDHFHPSAQPAKWRTGDEFIEQVEASLGDARGVGPVEAIDAVFAVLSKQISPGEIDKVRCALPHGIRNLWPEPVVGIQG